MRWDSKNRQNVEAPDVDAFLKELIEVCRKHGMHLGHEDAHGAFLVHRGPPDKHDEEWLLEAHIS